MMSNRAAFKRSFSSCNKEAASALIAFLSEQEKAFEGKRYYLYKDVSKSCMIIPSLQFTRGIQTKIALRSVVDVSAMSDAEATQVINWWKSSRIMLPLYVAEQHNTDSMYHAVSLYIWGVQDHNLTLKKFVDRFINDKENDSCQQHFTRYLCELLESEDCVDLLAEDSIPTWYDITELCSPHETVEKSRRKHDIDRSSTSEFTIGEAVALAFVLFVLTNVIARPIIVLGKDSADNKDPGVVGVYLPLVRSPFNCEKSPVVLLQVGRRFLPLYSCEDLNVPLSLQTVSDGALHCVPLCDSHFRPLKTYFVGKCTSDTNGSMHPDILHKYLDYSTVPDRHSSGCRDVAVAFLKFSAPPSFSLQLQWSWLRAVHQDCGNEVYPPGANVEVCTRSTVGCTNLGQPSMKGMCSDCYAKYLVLAQSIPKRASSLRKAKTMEPTATVKQPSSLKPAPPPSVKVLPTCITPGCGNPQIEHLLNRCRDCYLKHITSDSVSCEPPPQQHCCYPDCSSCVYPGMDLCQSHLRLLQQQSGDVDPLHTTPQSVYNWEADDATNSLPCRQVPRQQSPKPTPKMILTHGRGALHRPSDFDCPYLSNENAKVRNPVRINLNNPSPIYETPEIRQSPKQELLHPPGSGEACITTDQKSTDEFQIYDVLGNNVGAEALRQCILPECLHFVDDASSLVCSECSQQQYERLQAFEGQKEEDLYVDTRAFLSHPTVKVCQTPQCALPVASGTSLYCTRCELDQKPSSRSFPLEDRNLRLPQTANKARSHNALHLDNDVDECLPTGPCLTPSCDLFGSTKFNGFCSQCFRQGPYLTY